MSAVIIEKSPKEDLVHRINCRLKQVRDKGASPTILLCLEALLYLLESENNAGNLPEVRTGD